MTYTTPAARMAPLAALLMNDPTVMGHALVQAMIASKGKGAALKILENMIKDAGK